MTPKDKAQELVNKYINAGFNCKDCDMPFCDMKCTILHKHEAKECALIVVDEILQADMFMITEAQEEFWEQVRQEILDL